MLGDNVYYLSKVNKELKFLSNSEIRLRILVDLYNGPLKIKDIARHSLLSYSSISSNLHHEINSLSMNNLNKLYSLEGSKLIKCNSTDIYKTHKEFKRIFKDSKHLKVIFPYWHPEYPKLIRRLILKGVDVELIVPKNILDNFVKDIGKDVVKTGMDQGNFAMKYLDEHIRIALAISNKFISIGLFKIDGTYDQNRLLLSDKEKAINWGLNVYNSFDEHAVCLDTF